MRIYGNYFNAVLKKDESAKPKQTAGTNNRGLVLFTGNISPKALFATENHEAIKTLYKTICAEQDLPGGAAKSMATTQLWEKADQDFWAKKAKEFANDIDA